MSLSKPYVIAKLPNKTAEVLIYETIGKSFWEDGITAKSFSDDLRAIGDVRRIDVRINSPGGSVNDGLAIYNALVAHPAQIVAHIDGIAFSMASVIAMAGDTVTMADNALMMIHNPQWAAMGDAREMRKAADILDRYKSSLVKAYAKKTSLSEDDIAELMDAETYFDSEEAVAKGFADQITEPLAVAAKYDLANLPNGIVVPASVAERFKVSNVKGDEMTTETKPQEPVPATIEQLEAMAGASADFVLAQLKSKATREQALDALNAQLAEDLRVARHELTQQQAAKPIEEKPAAEQKPVERVSEGTEPMQGNRTPTKAELTPSEPDTGTLFEREFRRLRAEGMSANDAMKRIYAEHPAWREERLAELAK